MAQIPNRSIFIGDNLSVMRGIDDDTYDFIYADPPYNSDANYNNIFPDGSQHGFRDIWRLDDMDWSWLEIIGPHWPTVDEVCKTVRTIHSDGMMSYVCMMAVRLIEMNRILKPNGAVAIQCDDSANVYIRMVMDAVFGACNFFSEVVWKRTTAHNSVENQFGRIHDTIYIYAMPGHTWNQQFHKLTKEQIEDNYDEGEDERGKFGSADMMGSGITKHGSSGKPWRGIDPAKSGRGRHWTVPEQAKQMMPELNAMSTTQEKLDAMDAAGMILWPKKEGGIPRFKKRPDLSRLPLQNLWTDIPPVQHGTDDYRRWQTQKPVPLPERLILSFTNPGDRVLDPFCGCSTTLVAAERSMREWTGIDISPWAFREIRERLQIEAENNALLNGRFPEIHHRTDTPTLTHEIIKPYEFKEVLYGRQHGKCALCLENILFRHMTIDHVIPRKKGGQDIERNLQLLCGNCNSIKNKRTMEQAVVRLRELYPEAPRFRKELP